MSAGRCPSGARKPALIPRKRSRIMSCNAAVVRVNSLEARDGLGSRSILLADTTTLLLCHSLSLPLPPSPPLLHSSSVPSADARAIFSAGSSLSPLHHPPISLFSIHPLPTSTDLSLLPNPSDFTKCCSRAICPSFSPAPCVLAPHLSDRAAEAEGALVS